MELLESIVQCLVSERLVALLLSSTSYYIHKVSCDLARQAFTCVHAPEPHTVHALKLSILCDVTPPPAPRRSPVLVLIKSETLVAEVNVSALPGSSVSQGDEVQVTKLCGHGGLRERVLACPAGWWESVRRHAQTSSDHLPTATVIRINSTPPPPTYTVPLHSTSGCTRLTWCPRRVRANAEREAGMLSTQREAQLAQLHSANWSGPPFAPRRQMAS